MGLTDPTPSSWRPMGADSALICRRFADEVGTAGPVVCAGGRTQWDIGGPPDPAAREVRAPAGVVSFEPAEMIVRVRAGTPFAELDAALAEGGQMVPLDPPAETAGRATVGGLLAVGHSGIRRLRYGPIRDTLLEARFVSADGTLVKAGGPVVKNVSGYDLCRLLVGSLGTLGFLAEVVLRAQPRPERSQWFRAPSEGDGQGPSAVRRRLYRPSSILWDGATTWVLLEGLAADVEAERAALGPSFQETAGPPALPPGGRLSLRPSEAASLSLPAGSFVAEIGVGTVHVADTRVMGERRPVDPGVAELNRRVKATFDPTGRMNPGRVVG